MKERFIKLAITLISAVAVTFNLNISAIAASPGALDSSFGTGGVLTTAASNVILLGKADNVAVQPDGKIVVVSRTDFGSGDDDDFFVIRYNSDGSLDTTFDGDGKVNTDIFANDQATDVAIQADGKIVVVGISFSTGGNSICSAARYLPNGALDTTFSGDGKATVNPGFSTSERVESVALQADGKIVAAGDAVIGGSGDIMLFRLNIDGTIDTTFSNDGIAIGDSNSNESAYDLVIQPNGKIVTAGYVTAVGGSNFELARFNENGTLDTTFDGDGLVSTDFNTAQDVANSLAIQTDGKIVAGGSSEIFGSSNRLAAVTRYNINGSLDTTFDTDGKVTFDVSPGNSEEVRTILIESSGKIITAGEAGVFFQILRLNSNGSLDTTFGSDGFVLQQFGPSHFASSAALYGNKIIITGNASTNQILITRFNLSKSASQTGDFDGDGFTDSTVYRPSTATWFTLRSADNTVTQEQFGLNGDVPMDGDYDGDGRADLAIYRPSSGIWFFKRSSNGTTLGAQFGATGDKPQSGDFDKDGKSDIGVWRPSNGNYFILRSNSNFSNFFSYPFGASGDVPVQSGAQ